MLIKNKIVMLLCAFVFFAYNASAQKLLSEQSLPPELSIRLHCGNVYLGWLNPDGARQLSNEYEMVFEVTGGKNQLFSASGSFDWKDRTVFIAGSNWWYDDNTTNGWSMIPNVSNYSFQSQPFQTDLGRRALFKLVPGTVFAAPNTEEGFYTFTVNLEIQDITY